MRFGGECSADAYAAGRFGVLQDGVARGLDFNFRTSVTGEVRGDDCRFRVEVEAFVPPKDDAPAARASGVDATVRLSMRRRLPRRVAHRRPRSTRAQRSPTDDGCSFRFAHRGAQGDAHRRRRRPVLRLRRPLDIDGFTFGFRATVDVPLATLSRTASRAASGRTHFAFEVERHQE